MLGASASSLSLLGFYAAQNIQSRLAPNREYFFKNKEPILILVFNGMAQIKTTEQFSLIPSGYRSGP